MPTAAFDKAVEKHFTKRIWVLFQNVHRFTLKLHGLKIMIVESFPSNITY